MTGCAQSGNSATKTQALFSSRQGPTPSPTTHPTIKSHNPYHNNNTTGPQWANKIDELLERVDAAGSQLCATEQVAIEEDIATPRRDSTLTAWVNVIYGCNESCTYCVVPSTRGQEQSRKVEDIRREVLALGEAGESLELLSVGGVAAAFVGKEEKLLAVCWLPGLPFFTHTAHPQHASSFNRLQGGHAARPERRRVRPRPPGDGGRRLGAPRRDVHRPPARGA